MIEVTNVSKNFGSLSALSDVTLSVEPGERVAFVGTNGSGKTTLLRALLGLIRTSGRISIAGIDVARAPQHALKHVAYIPQIAPPADAPVREVVRAIAALRGIEPRRIAERALAFGLSLELCAATRFVHLSGGMKQKLLAAAALAADTPILIGDEPTANLDTAARGVFFEQIQRSRADRIVILCSHRPDELAQIADRIIEFREGRIAHDTLHATNRAESSALPKPLRTAC